MALDVQQVYADWETRWLLSNPKPTIELRDQFLDVLKYMVAGGAILLSGSRTGNVVSNIGALSDFGEKLAYFGLSRPVFIGIEALLAFLTFDAAILLAGYLGGDDHADERWYIVLLALAFIPSLAANVFPGVRLINEQAVLVGTIVVDVVIGVFTPAMAFVAGRVIGATNNACKKKMGVLVATWQEHKNAAWVRSSEYRKWNKKEVADRPLSISVVAPEQPDRGARIIETLRERGPMNVSELAQVLGDSTVNVLADTMQMEGVVRSGSSISLPRVPDF